MPGTPGIYLHIPFCERKCTYCNFNTTDFANGLAARYIRALAREIKYWGDHLAQRNGGQRLLVDSVYFGGGTPSLVEARQLADLIEQCKETFRLSQDAEITIEINPGSFSRPKLAQWLEAGINRASVGIQSFIDSELKSLSRTHTAEDARHTVESLREAGFKNLSLDLIAGFPEQTIADWEFNLGEALRLNPEHLSLYLLEVKEGTQLFAQIKRGARPVPDDDSVAEMYRIICRITREAGYDHYEISNFAKIAAKLGTSAPTNSLRSKHNLKYWTGAPFYGMGCGAHSYDGQVRWFNTLQTEAYIESVSKTGRAIAQTRELTERERAEEALFMGLRLGDGIILKDFNQEYSIDLLRDYDKEVRRMVEAGLVQVDGDRIGLTETGMLLSNEVFIAFV
jgi:oxygen-independent coproporphyrinogen-3 oxidase